MEEEYKFCCEGPDALCDIGMRVTNKREYTGLDPPYGYSAIERRLIGGCRPTNERTFAITALLCGGALTVLWMLALRGIFLLNLICSYPGNTVHTEEVMAGVEMIIAGKDSKAIGI